MKIEALLLSLAVIVGLFALAVRLKEVQVDGAAEYRRALDGQSVRRVCLSAPRGRILDARGRVLAGNRQCVAVAFDASGSQRRSGEATLKALLAEISRASAVVGREARTDEAAVRRHLVQTPLVPLVVWEDASDAEIARLAERAREFPGLVFLDYEERTYPFGSLAAHAIGSVRRLRGGEAASEGMVLLGGGDLCGRDGLEGFYDGYLRGAPGERMVLVDARCYAQEGETTVPPRRGLDLRLALDADVQRAVEAELAGESGAAVVLNARTGGVLAIASAPTYSLNRFVPVLRSDVYAALTNNPAKPLLNRAVGGTYPPGSTFKPVTALAALSLGFPADHRYECEGFFRQGSFRLNCSRRWGHGSLDLREALTVSCNPYFCNMGAEAGTNALCRAARAFGLGSRTGIDLGGEVSGVVPDAAWKERTYGCGWVSGDLLQMSIGQGMLLVTPLQMARVAAALATGRLVTPHLKADLPAESVALPFAAADLAAVREGMEMVVNDLRHGSGVKGGIGVPVRVAGKTGTAEVGTGERRRKHTWFIAYAPASAPEVAVAMVIENGASGGGTVAPKVASVIRAVFAGRDDG